MNEIIREITTAIIVSVIYLLIFSVSEVIHRKTKIPTEWTRKGVHFLSAIIGIFFPFIFKYTITLFILAFSFLIILFIGERKRMLDSIGGVERETKGEFLFPISLFIIYVLSKNNYIIYLVSLLVLAISDPLAAIIGKIYGHLRYKVQTDMKTLEGSITFFFITFLIVHIPVLIYTNVSRANSIWISLVVAILITSLESVSMEGSDNLLIPLGTFFVLYKLITKPTEIVFLQVLILITIFISCIILSIRLKNISASGLIVIVIVSYAAFALCGLNWYIPTLLFFIGYLIMNLIFRIKPADDPRLFRVRPLLKLVFIPMFFVFLSNFFSLEKFLYPIYLASVSIHLSLLWSHFYLDRNIISRFFKKHRSVFMHFGPVISFFVISLPCYLIFDSFDIKTLYALFIINFFADFLYYLLRSILYREISYSFNRDLRNFIVLVFSLVLLILKSVDAF